LSVGVERLSRLMGGVTVRAKPAAFGDWELEAILDNGRYVHWRMTPRDLELSDAELEVKFVTPVLQAGKE
jgi:hypothetical protein